MDSRLSIYPLPGLELVSVSYLLIIPRLRVPIWLLWGRLGRTAVNIKGHECGM